MHSNPRAKVNLTLSVGPRAADGYHALVSVFLRVGLSDDLTVAFGEGSGADVLTVSGLPGCPVDGNLVLRAFARVRHVLGRDLPPLAAHLDKRIPMQAGLGGGSSDGAAALDAALQMWRAELAPDALTRVALELGSDVPFFAANTPAALVSGRGENVEPLPAIRGGLGLLLVTPPLTMSTARVFAHFDELGRSPRERPPLDASFLARLPEAAAELRDANDLWPAAVSLEPQLGALRDDLERQTGRPWLLSGSGSTMFALYPSAAAAADAGRELVAAAPERLAGATLNAVDLVGPDPAWRYPWPSEQ